MAWDSIRGHAGRALLTMLGVIIGVAAVIALVAAGTGASRLVASRIAALGANLVFISPNPAAGGSLTQAQVGLIAHAVPLLGAVMPVDNSSGPLVYGGTSQGVPFSGVTQQWPRLRDARVARGRFLTAADVRTHALVADLGANVAVNFFGQLDPVGHHVRLDGATFTVIGVMAPKGFAFGGDADNFVYIPVSTAADVLQTDQVSVVDAQVRSAAQAADAADQLTRWLAAWSGNPTAFDVSSEDQLLATVSANRQTFTDLLGGTAAISLIVGGIGIMNIMLASVSERTREIGVRKAVGARFADILAQFLMEAVVLSEAGGVLGAGIGVAGSGAVARLAGWPAVVDSGTVAVAFGFALLVGVLFGAYPAARAAALDPIAALRHE